MFVLFPTFCIQRIWEYVLYPSHALSTIPRNLCHDEFFQAININVIPPSGASASANENSRGLCTLVHYCVSAAKIPSSSQFSIKQSIPYDRHSCQFSLSYVHVCLYEKVGAVIDYIYYKRFTNLLLGSICFLGILLALYSNYL